MFDTRDLLSHSLRCHMKSRDPCFSVSRANSAPMRFKPKPSSGGRFGIEDAKERSFKGRFRLGIISSSSSVSGAGLLSKSTDPATKSRSNASLTKSVTAGCEARASGFFGCPMNLSSLQRNWRWRGSVTRLSTERRGTEPSRFARPPSSGPSGHLPPQGGKGSPSVALFDRPAQFAQVRPGPAFRAGRAQEISGMKHRQGGNHAPVLVDVLPPDAARASDAFLGA